MELEVFIAAQAVNLLCLNDFGGQAVGMYNTLLTGTRLDELRSDS